MTVTQIIVLAYAVGIVVDFILSSSILSKNPVIQKKMREQVESGRMTEEQAVIAFQIATMIGSFLWLPSLIKSSILSVRLIILNFKLKRLINKKVKFAKKLSELDIIAKLGKELAVSGEEPTDEQVQLFVSSLREATTDENLKKFGVEFSKEERERLENLLNFKSEE